MYPLLIIHIVIIIIIATQGYKPLVVSFPLSCQIHKHILYLIFGSFFQ